MRNMRAEYAAVTFSALTFAAGIISAIEFSRDAYASLNAFNSFLIEGGSNANLVSSELISFVETVAVFGIPTLVMSASVLFGSHRMMTGKRL